MGRSTQGVTIFRVAENEHVVSVAKIDESDEEEIELEGGEEIDPAEDAVTNESELDRPPTRSGMTIRPEDPPMLWAAASQIKASAGQVRHDICDEPAQPRRLSAFSYESPSGGNVHAPSTQCAGSGRRWPQDAVLPQPWRRRPDRPSDRGARPKGDRKDSDIKTDSPGAIHQSAGYGRSTYEETDFHQQEEDRWIKEAADELNKRALRNDFDALAIVAPPKALGVLRKELRKDVESRSSARSTRK